MSVLDDIGGDNVADGVDERMASGGILPVGFYAATLTGARDVESKSNQTPGYELTFSINSGPQAGAEFTESIWRSDKQASRDRIKLFAHRLGVIAKSPDGKTYVPIEGKEGFGDVLDTPCIIEIIHEPDQKNPNKMWPRLAFGGIYLADDKEALAAVKNGGKKPAKEGAGQAKAAPAAPSKSPPAKPTPGTPPANTRKKLGIDNL